MPQEIEVWYIIPALRRELAKLFVKDYNLSQKESAQILSITEAAISQYLKSKRAIEVKFSDKELAEIKKVAKKIVDNPDSLMEVLYKLCLSFRGSDTICDLHKIKDCNVAKDCEICL